MKQLNDFIKKYQDLKSAFVLVGLLIILMEEIINTKKFRMFQMYYMLWIMILEVKFSMFALLQRILHMLEQWEVFKDIWIWTFLQKNSFLVYLGMDMIIPV